MVRSLYTAATGMMAQQTNVDTIANNLSNVNTVGYKEEVTSFKSLLYQNLQTRTTSANGEEKPVSAQVGLGSRVSAITSQYTQGALNASDSNTDFAISGNGFFGVENPNPAEDGSDDTLYTRNGNFYFAVSTEGVMLSTADGYAVLSSDGQPIVFDAAYDPSKLTIDSSGNIYILMILTIHSLQVLRLVCFSLLIHQVLIRRVIRTLQLQMHQVSH